MPRTENRRRLSGLHGISGQPDRGAGLAPQGRGGRLFHPDRIGGVDDLEIERSGAGMTRQLALDDVTVADEEQPHLKVTRGDQGAVDDRAGPKVAAHRVDGDAHAFQLSALSFQLSFADRPDLTALRHWLRGTWDGNRAFTTAALAAMLAALALATAAGAFGGPAAAAEPVPTVAIPDEFGRPVPSSDLPPAGPSASPSTVPIP